MSQNREPPSSESGALEKHLDLVVSRGASRKGKAFLMVSAGEAAGTVFPLTRSSLLIGRSADADVRVNENAVSNEHARVEIRGGNFIIRDLESTNGTFVNGRRITDSASLVGGDTIRTGSTIFTFVTREAGAPAATVRLQDYVPEAPVAGRVYSRAPADRMVPSAPPSSTEEALSLTDVVRTIQTSWTYVKRYGWLALTCLLFGIAAGLIQARLSPPPASAWFEMSLMPEGRNVEGEGPQSFLAAENTFRSLPLIKQTLAELGAGTVDDATASQIQSALTFERQGYNSSVWRGDYQDATGKLAVQFLQKHVDVYIGSEIDKILKVLKADAEFDRQQEGAAEERVAAARNQLLDFIDEHPEAVPKDAKLPERLPTRLPANASPDRIRRSIASAQRALSAAYANIQTKQARPYLDQAVAAENKLAEARARGLGDQHPEVKNLLKLAQAMRTKANQVLRAEPSETERNLDPDIPRLKREIADLNQRLQRVESAAAASPAAGETGADRKSGANLPPESLAQRKLRYTELARDYERAKTEHEALMKKRDATDRLLERERTSAEARYDIITPPTAEVRSAGLTLIKRGGLGGMIGLVLAVIAAACLELRRLLIARGHL